MMQSVSTELPQLDQAHLECYRGALSDLAQYAIELEEATTANYRRALLQLAEEAPERRPEDAPELLRDYRAQATGYVNRLCEELAITARSLQQILNSLAEADGDYEGRTCAALARLREIVRSSGGGPVTTLLVEAFGAIQGGLAKIREQHELTVAQLVEEIRKLHTRIDQLESAASVELLATLATRVEMEGRIQGLPAGAPRLVLLSLTGLRLAEKRFDQQMRRQLAAAFLKRLGRVLPVGTVIGWWSEEEFMAILPKRTPELQTNILNEQLSGPYPCSRQGKTVRPILHVKARLMGSP
jgi:GGDEF domain-containing protein